MTTHRPTHRTRTAVDPHDDGAPHDHDRGLAHDLVTLVDRRRALAILGGGAAAAVLAACSSGSSGSSGSSATSTTAAAGGASTTGATSASGERIPEETAGPYPGDGSNGPDVLGQDGVVREDIRGSFAGSSGTAEGSPLRISFEVVDASSGAVRTGLAVYAWHADAEGRYSMYSSGIEDQNYLRGVQATGDDGVASFLSIFPGCYDGRWPHVHFEVYSSVDDALSGGSPVATSQIALPQDVCEEVYSGQGGYETSSSNLGRVSLTSDMVFSDSWEQQLGTMSGAVGDDLTVTLRVPV